MLAMTCLTKYASKGVDSIIRKMVNDIFGRDDILERLPIYFMKESYKRKSQASNDNICSFNGRKIQFSTVHKVKGETHDSTLYLETEKQSSSDLKRVLSYLKGTKSRISPLCSTRYWLWESACLQQKYRGLLRYLDCKR